MCKPFKLINILSGFIVFGQNRININHKYIKYTSYGNMLNTKLGNIWQNSFSQVGKYANHLIAIWHP